MSNNMKKMMVPMLRFPEFRDAGEWELKPLSEIGKVLQGYGFPEALQGKKFGEYPFCKVSDISNAILGGNNLISSAANYVDKDDLNLLRAKTIPVGTTIFAKIGEAIRSNRRALTTLECLIDNNVAGVKGTNGKADDLYVFYVLSQINLIEYSGGAVPSVNKSTLESIPVFTTSPEEQQKIASCLSSIDELITAQSQKVDALKTHKKALMQQLFPREGETIPRLRFPEFRDAGEWELKKLSQLATYTKGFAFKSQDYRESGVRIIRVSDLGADFIKCKNEKIYIASNSASDYERYVLNTGEIIITTVGSKPELIDSAVGRGIFVYSSNEGLLNQNLLKLEAMSEVNSRFLFSNINTEKYQKFIASISRGNANQANIAVKDLMDFELQVPGSSEQNKIASCLSSIDDLITAQSENVDALKSHKQGLMQQLFPFANEVDA